MEVTHRDKITSVLRSEYEAFLKARIKSLDFFLVETLETIEGFWVEDVRSDSLH